MLYRPSLSVSVLCSYVYFYMFVLLLLCPEFYILELKKIYFLLQNHWEFLCSVHALDSEMIPVPLFILILNLPQKYDRGREEKERTYKAVQEHLFSRI